MVTLIWVVKEPFCLPWFMELTGAHVHRVLVSTSVLTAMAIDRCSRREVPQRPVAHLQHPPVRQHVPGESARCCSPGGSGVHHSLCLGMRVP